MSAVCEALEPMRGVIAMFTAGTVGVLCGVRVKARSPGAENLHTGKAIYEAGCAGCHENDGRGAPESTAGFAKPDSFPDFSRCDQTTAEYDVDYRATIIGGAARGDFRRSCRRSATR